MVRSYVKEGTIDKLIAQISDNPCSAGQTGHGSDGGMYGKRLDQLWTS